MSNKQKKSVKQAMAKKEREIRKERYTNLMLVTVMEAMALLILQLLIYNAWAIPTLAGAMWSIVTPAIFWVAVAATVVMTFLAYKKDMKKLFGILSFVVYVVLLMAIMRYIPNQYSEISGKWIVNSLRGQKIGVITSVVYVAAKFGYFTLLSKKVK